MSKLNNKKNIGEIGYSKNIVLKIIFFIACIFIAINLVIYPIFLSNAHRKIDEIEKQIVTLQENVEALKNVNEENDKANNSIISDIVITTENEYQQMISFLENESSKHREFIENQRQFLIWILGIIGTFSVFVMGIVGLSNRKDIDEAVQKQYEQYAREKFDEQLDKSMDKALDINDSIKYLQNAVEIQKRISEKKILFIYQKERERFKEIERLIDNKIADIQTIESASIVKNGEVDISEYKDFIIVYEVKESEFDKNVKIENPEKNVSDSDKENKAGDVKNETSNTVADINDLEYVKLFNACNNNISCIFFVEGKDRISHVEFESINMCYSNTMITLYNTLSLFLEL